MSDKFVAAGDSWLVDLPFDFATGGGLAKALFGRIMGVNYVNLSHAGDSTEELMGLAMASKLEANLPDAKILLFSGGGDDFAGDQFEIWLNDNTDNDVTKAVNFDRLNSGLDLTIADYERLIEIRDKVAPDCIIVTHTYDLPPAEVLGCGVLTMGPWLKPGMVHRGWLEPVQQVAIVETVLKAFRDRLMVFAEGKRLFLVADTQGTCASDDWANELHLKASGCYKVAQVINEKLLPQLAG